MYYPFKIGIFGQSGYGKTYLLTRILKHLKIKSIILDIEHEIRDNTFNFSCGKNIFDFIREFLEASKGVYVVNPDCKEDLKVFFNLLPYLKRCVIGIDELVPISNQQNFENNNLRDAIFFGRHRELGIIGGSQRIRGIPKSFVSQCNMIITFRLSDPNDRQYLKGKFSNSELEEIGVLPEFKYLTFPKHIDINNLFDK